MKFLNFIAASMLLASPVAAATVTSVGTIDFSTDTATIAAFDGSLGTLQSAVLNYESFGRVIFEASCTALENRPCSVTAAGSLELFLNGPSGLIDTVFGTGSDTVNCNVFSSGFRRICRADEIIFKTMDGTANLALTDVTGPSPFVFSLTDTRVRLNSDTGIRSAIDGIESASITYTFAPTAVPLPASAPLVLGGLGILGWIGRRKRAAAA